MWTGEWNKFACLLAPVPGLGRMAIPADDDLVCCTATGLVLYGDFMGGKDTGSDERWRSGAATGGAAEVLLLAVGNNFACD